MAVAIRFSTATATATTIIYVIIIFAIIAKNGNINISHAPARHPYCVFSQTFLRVLTNFFACSHKLFCVFSQTFLRVLINFSACVRANAFACVYARINQICETEQSLETLLNRLILPAVFSTCITYVQNDPSHFPYSGLSRIVV